MAVAGMNNLAVVIATAGGRGIHWPGAFAAAGAIGGALDVREAR